MYSIIDWLFTLASWFLVIWLPYYLENATYFLVGIVAYAVYPVILEPIYNLLAVITFTERSALKEHSVNYSFQSIFTIRNFIPIKDCPFFTIQITISRLVELKKCIHLILVNIKESSRNLFRNPQ